MIKYPATTNFDNLYKKKCATKFLDPQFSNKLSCCIYTFFLNCYCKRPRALRDRDAGEALSEDRENCLVVQQSTCIQHVPTRGVVEGSKDVSPQLCRSRRLNLRLKTRTYAARILGM